MSDIGRVKWIDKALQELNIRRELPEVAPGIWFDLRAGIDNAIAYLRSVRQTLVIVTNGNQENIRTITVQDAPGHNARWRRAAIVTFDLQKLTIESRYEFTSWESKAPKPATLKIAVLSNKQAGLTYKDQEIGTLDAVKSLLWPVLFPEIPEAEGD